MAITTNGIQGVGPDTVQTLTNKTLEAPVINNATFTGAQAGLEVKFGNNIVFEGTTADAYETTLTAGDPTADRTITLPNSTGTVALTSDLTSYITASSTDTLTNKTLTSPVMTTPTITGAIFNDGSVVFEGATADAYETTLAITDPTADRTITFPDSTGTVALTSDITVTASSTTTLTNKTLTDPKINLAVNAQTGTSYTLVLTDNGKFVTCSNASAITVTIPPASSVAYDTGAQINIIQKGAGQVTFAQGSGVTIRSTGATSTAPALRTQYSTATCVYEGSDVWYVVGDIS